MREPHLFDVNKDYALCGEATLTFERVDQSALEAAWRAVSPLRTALEDVYEQEYWRRLSWTLRQYCRSLVTNPLPFGCPEVYDSERFADLACRTAELRAAYPGPAVAAASAIEAVRLVAETEPGNPLMERLEPLCDSPNAAVVLANVGLAGAVIAALDDACIDIRLVAATSLSSLECYERLILIGPTWHFPKHAFSAPRATELISVSYSFLDEDWEPRPDFECSEAAHWCGARVRGARPSRRVTAPLGPDEQRLAREMLAGPSIADVGAAAENDFADTAAEEVEAILVLLEGNKAVFLDAGDDSRAHVINLLEHSDRRVPVRDLDPGSLVVLRTESGRDYVVEVADQILGGQAVKLRESQAHWKAELRAVADALGLEEVIRRLGVARSHRAGPDNLRNWMSSRGIKTDDRRDFDAIMSVIRRSDDADQVWRDMEVITTAHQMAGQRIRRLLDDRMRSADWSVLELEGYMEFELDEDGAGRLAVARVTEVSENTFTVAASRIGRMTVIGVTAL